MIRACDGFGLALARVDGRSGAWVTGQPAQRDQPGQPGPASQPSQDRKVAAIGIRVARGVTMHGFALNCSNDLSWYDRIVPCGISDASVSSMTVELGRPVTVAAVIEPVKRHLADVLGATSYTEASTGEFLATAVSPAAPVLAPLPR